MNEGRRGLLDHVFFLDPHTDYLGVLLLFKFSQQQVYIMCTPMPVCYISRVLKPQSQFHKNKLTLGVRKKQITEFLVVVFRW